MINLRRRDQAAMELMQRVEVKAHSGNQSVAELSGGNQQKVAIARILHQQADILMMDEPTKGIDVGTKAEIYRMMGELAAEGKTIVFVSSYLPELLAVCDRIGVMARGELREVRDAKDWTEDDVMATAIALDDAPSCNVPSSPRPILVDAYAKNNIQIATRAALRLVVHHRCCSRSQTKSGAQGFFLSVRNMRVIMSSAALIAVPAFGMTIIIIAAGIDLSAGTALTLCGTVLALQLKNADVTTADPAFASTMVFALMAMILHRVPLRVRQWCVDQCDKSRAVHRHARNDDDSVGDRANHCQRVDRLRAERTYSEWLKYLCYTGFEFAKLPDSRSGYSCECDHRGRAWHSGRAGDAIHGIWTKRIRDGIKRVDRDDFAASMCR